MATSKSHKYAVKVKDSCWDFVNVCEHFVKISIFYVLIIFNPTGFDEDNFWADLKQVFLI